MEATLKAVSDKMDTLQTTLDRLSTSLTAIAVLQERTKNQEEAIARSFKYTEKLHADLSDHSKANHDSFEALRAKNEANRDDIQRYVNRWVGASAVLAALASVASITVLILRFFIT